MGGGVGRGGGPRKAPRAPAPDPRAARRDARGEGEDERWRQSHARHLPPRGAGDGAGEAPPARRDTPGGGQEDRPRRRRARGAAPRRAAAPQDGELVFLRGLALAPVEVVKPSRRPAVRSHHLLPAPHHIVISFFFIMPFLDRLRAMSQIIDAHPKIASSVSLAIGVTIGLLSYSVRRDVRSTTDDPELQKRAIIQSYILEGKNQKTFEIFTALVGKLIVTLSNSEKTYCATWLRVIRTDDFKTDPQAGLAALETLFQELSQFSNTAQVDNARRLTAIQVELAKRIAEIQGGNTELPGIDTQIEAIKSRINDWNRYNATTDVNRARKTAHLADLPAWKLAEEQRKGRIEAMISAAEASRAALEAASR